MATPKYKLLFDEMLTTNKDLFDAYEALLKNYDKSPKKFANETSEMQFKLLRVIKKTEDKLCARTENTGRGVYSTALADKFWEEIRSKFPRIDEYIETS